MSEYCNAFGKRGEFFRKLTKEEAEQSQEEMKSPYYNTEIWLCEKCNCYHIKTDDMDKDIYELLFPRLTTKRDVSEMDVFKLKYNSCYIKDGELRYRNYKLDISIEDLIKKMLITFGADEDFEEIKNSLEYMHGIDLLKSFDSIEVLIALFYRNLCALAEFRERLMKYEDLEGKLEMPLKKFADILEKSDNCKNPQKAIVLTDEDVDKWHEYKKLQTPNKPKE